MISRNLARITLAVLVAVVFAAPAPAQPPAPVFVAPVVERHLAPQQKFVGTVMPLRMSQVGSAVNGRVEQYLVNEGERVRKGQPLAILRTAIIRTEVAAAQADLQARQAELDELRNGSRPEEILQAEARLDAADAMLNFRRLVLQRNRTAGAGASPQDLDESLTLYNQAEAALRDARATLNLLKKGPRDEKIAFAAAKVQAQQAEVDRLQEQLERHTIYAPFDGYIAAEHAEVGQWLMQGAPLVDVTELDTVEIEVNVLEDYVRFLKVGAIAPVEVGAFPDQQFRGWISAVVPQGNTRARTFPVKVRVYNPVERRMVMHDPVLTPALSWSVAAAGPTGLLSATSALFDVRVMPTLKAGMFARVSLPTANPKNALLVSRDALVLGGAQRVVYVVDAESPGEMKGKARPVPVELGASEGNLVQVIGNLQRDQLVVVQGNERLRPGQDVVIAKVQAPK